MLLRYFVPDLDYSEIAVHAALLADRVRVDSYLGALAKVVTPGTRLIELGAGTGVFGRLAVQLGAEAYLVEQEGRPAMLSRLLNLLLAPGCPISTISGKIEEVSVPPCEIVIHELLGPRLLDEGLARKLGAFAKNNLWYDLPTTKVVPQATSLWCQATFVDPSAFSRPLPRWTDLESGSAPIRGGAADPSPIIWTTDPKDVIPRSDWQLIATFDAKHPADWTTTFNVSLDVCAEANALLWGFTIYLAHSRELDVRLGIGKCTSWGGVLEQLPSGPIVSTGRYRFCGDLPGVSANRIAETGTWLRSVQFDSQPVFEGSIAGDP